MMELEFYGAAGHVTGSCHVLRIGDQTVLLDCGLIQGGGKDEVRNADPFPFDAEGVDAVVLSHAHIDHSGRLPLLCKRGFSGAIHAQNATFALMSILLRDAASLEASRIRRENRRRSERKQPLVAPLYEVNDVELVLGQVASHAYDSWFDVATGVRARFADAGHIMGSAVVEVEIRHEGVTRTLIFSGDLGQYDSPILRDPVTPKHANLVLMESTYGNRRHRDRAASLVEFGEVLQQAHEEEGNVLIPAFAVGRSQEILYHLGTHLDEWQVDRWHIFLDSPLAIQASDVYWDYSHLHDEEAAAVLRGDDIMPRLPNLHYTRSAEESKVIGRLRRGALIIAGSGMCNGGRILHHFKREIGRPNTHIVFTGFQPPGTMGRAIIDGVDSVRIHGETYAVRAQIHTIGGFSAHGDQDDLLRWYGGISNRPNVFLVHGEPSAAEALGNKLAFLGADATVAGSGQRVDIAALSRD